MQDRPPFILSTGPVVLSWERQLSLGFGFFSTLIVALDMSSDGPFSPFPPSDIGAATVVNVFAVISASALFSVALRIFWLAVCQKLSPEGTKPQEYIFFNTQLGYYALCLLIANSITDGAGLIGLRWLIMEGIAEGTLCTVQAVLMQFGTFSTAFFTVSIAVHTFKTLVLRKRQSKLIAWITITIGWVYSGLLVALPFTYRKAFKFGAVYGPDYLSCGVRSIYLKTQFSFHLLPIFIASILSAILYPLTFLVLRGTLTIKGGIKLILDPNERNAGTLGQNYHRFVIRVAKSMLWYPVAYIALLVPYSVVRLLSISGFPVAFGVLIFAYVCWFMLGIVNVLLLYNTFRVLGPAFDTLSQRESGMSFGPSTQLDFDAQSFDNKQQKDFSEKVAQYRNAPPLHRTPSITSVDRSSPTLRPLLPIHEQPERYGSASVQSFYSYSSHPSIGRAINSIHELERSSPSPRMSPRPSHSRQGTLERIGLPPAPRPTRSPILLRPSREDLAVPAWPSPNPTLQRQYSGRTLGKRNSHDNRESAGSVFSDFSAEWQMAEPTSAYLSNNHPHPPLSAVTPTFRYAGLPRVQDSPKSASIRTESPIGLQRPGPGGRGGSIGNVAVSGPSSSAGNYF